MLKQNFEYFFSTFLQDQNLYKKAPTPRIKSDYSAFVLAESLIPEEIAKATPLADTYLCNGSVGQGEVTDLPWIAIFDRSITISAQKGYYIVFLFRTDMRGVYLSLNQGVSQYNEKFKSKARVELARTSLRARTVLHSTQDFSFEDINLGSDSARGKEYEAGNICSKYYSAIRFPSDEELIFDINNLLGIYRELKGIIGDNILDISTVLDEDSYQTAAQESSGTTLGQGPQEKSQKKARQRSVENLRNPDIAHLALTNADFLCERDASHITFISAANNKNYVEAHHLIPMKYYDEFQASIDVPENIISLCPNCHREFHHSKPRELAVLLKDFFERRKIGLKKRGIEITLDRLTQWYDD